MVAMNVNILRSELEALVNSVDTNSLLNNRYFETPIGDQIWINQWINSRLNTRYVTHETIVEKPKPIATNISVNEFQIEFKSALNLLTEFNHKLNVLNENIDTFDDKLWISLLNELNERKRVLNDKLLSITSSVPIIKCKIKANKRKRSGKSNKNVNHKQLVTESMENRNKLIEDWIESNRESRERSERERDVQKEANTVSIEVKKKINDTKKCLKKVNSIERLRSILKTRAQQRSEEISQQSDLSFSQQINELKKVLKERLEMYRKELNAINSMVSTECDKQFNDKRQEVSNEVTECQQNIYECLFGNQLFPETNNLDSVKSWQFFDKSHHNIHNMIAIRSQWDSYIDMNSGTSIPKNYIMPNTTPSNEWQKYLQN